MNKAIYDLDFDEFIWQLPVPSPLNSAFPNRRYTALLCIAGFEPRCYASLKRLFEIDCKFDSTFCIHYEHKEMSEANEVHAQELFTDLSVLSGGQNPFDIYHNTIDFTKDFGEYLVRALSDTGIDLHSSDTRICFDISVGSSRLLLEGLHGLLSTEVDLTLLYSESEYYRPSFDEYIQYHSGHKSGIVVPPEFLTLGVERVELLKRILGTNTDTRPTYLVLFPSFSPTRIGAVIEELSPSRVYWLFGIPHLVKNRWRIDAQTEYHANLIEQSHGHCYVSTFDYRETLQALDNIYREYSKDFTILICSLGSKLQKVGQVLFHYLRPEVGAVASIPRQWDPENYSGKEAREVYFIALGNCKDLRTQLWHTRTFRI